MKDQKTYTTDEMIDFIKSLNTNNAPITDKIIDTLENYNKCIAQLQAIQNILQPLQQSNTHNDYLEQLKKIIDTPMDELNPNTKNSIELSTPAGQIAAYVSNVNDFYPRINIMLQPRGTDREVDLCSVQMIQDKSEQHSDDHIYTYVFNDPYDEDYTEKFDLDVKDVIHSITQK